MSCEQSPKSLLSKKNRSDGVHITPELQKEEKEAVDNRKTQVVMSLNKLGIKADEAPVLAVLGSGGGLRAHFACLGVLIEMKNHGLLDVITYLAGVSGSTWALSSFYTNSGNMEHIEADLEHRFELENWSIWESLQKTIEAASLENYSLTDFWAYIVVSRQTREFQGSLLSSMKKHVEKGTLPYPIFAAIDNDLHPGWKDQKTQKSWFEFTPHHAGYPALKSYIPITQFGSQFENGRLVKSALERDLSFLRGLWGSAVANTEENKKFIWDEFLSLKEKLLGKHQLTQGMIEKEITVDEALLELTVDYIKDEKDPSIQKKLQALQQALDAGRDEHGEPECRKVAMMIQNWSNASQKEQGLILETLVCHFTGQASTMALSTALSVSKLTISDILAFLAKTAKCIWNWEWGTIHNFLHQHHGSNVCITDEDMCSRKLLHLVDAGLAINSPYPLLLPPAREVQLILSFDFSDGDPFETVRATADYCHHHKIPFPLVKEADLKEWAEAPTSCYILKGESGPVVMHFPLFNKDNCGDDINTWRDKYGTFKLSDTYSVQLVKDLLEKSKENVRKNKEKIIRTIKEVVGSCPETS
ncbi:cytosolic phospholipase A2 gamma-like isoform X2 [Castor canadensis]|uniref:Cytosolic phospholipase A2 gamma-like isoform X2 n=1 Tax=Castor canadensis TaxID=51338 RepID=A0AC58L9Z4_CASCN